MHYSALVILPEGGETDPKAVTEALLAPYDESLVPADAEDYGDAFWDWWRIGGRWDGEVRGLARLDEATHYSDAWEQPERNMAPVRDIAEYQTFTIVAPDGEYRHREEMNPEWIENGYDSEAHSPVLETPGFAEWRARVLLAYRDRFAVVVDYHR